MNKQTDKHRTTDRATEQTRDKASRQSKQTSDQQSEKEMGKFKIRKASQQYTKPPHPQTHKEKKSQGQKQEPESTGPKRNGQV